MNTYKSNTKLMDAVKKIVAKAGAQGDVQVLSRTDERAFELQEYAKRGLSGCNFRSEGNISVSLIYDGFLEAVVIDEDLKSLDGNIAKKIEKEARAKADWLQEIREEQERNYWESQGYTY